MSKTTTQGPKLYDPLARPVPVPAELLARVARELERPDDPRPVFRLFAALRRRKLAAAVRAAGRAES